MNPTGSLPEIIVSVSWIVGLTYQKPTSNL